MSQFVVSWWFVVNAMLHYFCFFKQISRLFCESNSVASRWQFSCEFLYTIISQSSALDVSAKLLLVWKKAISYKNMILCLGILLVLDRKITQIRWRRKKIILCSSIDECKTYANIVIFNFLFFYKYLWSSLSRKKKSKKVLRKNSWHTFWKHFVHM